MNIKFLKAALAAAAIVGTVFTCEAGLISGTQTTDNGKVVALQGLEWMSLDYTANKSRNDIEGGFTDNYGTAWAAGEWTYATRAQTETLINSLWGGTYDGWSADNGDGAAWFMKNFGGLGYDTWSGGLRTDGTYNSSQLVNYDYSYFIFGAESDCANNGNSCLGYANAADSVSYYLSAVNVQTLVNERSYSPGQGRAGRFFDTYGGAFGRYANNATIYNGTSNTTYGSLLVRAVGVPEPTTVSILALGLLGLGLRRKKQS